MENKQPPKAVWVVAILFVILLMAALNSEDMVKKNKIKEYLENKYGIPFEILGARSDGIKGNSSFNVMSPAYPNTVDSVSIFDVGTPEEKIIEDYGFMSFRDQWENYYAHRIKDFFGKEAYMAFGFCLPKENLDARFREKKVDLNALSFEKLGESGGGQLEGVDLKIFIIRDMPNENYDPIYQNILVWFKHLKSIGFTRASIQILGFAEYSLNIPEIAAEKKALDERNGLGAGDLYHMLLDSNIKGPKRLTYGHGFQVSFMDLSKIETIEDIKKELTFKKVE